MNYDKILLKEYQEAGQKPWRMKFGSKKSVIIPYLYTLDATSKEDIANRFEEDFFDINLRLAQDYKKRGERPLFVESGGRRYVVPYQYSKEEYDADKIAKKVFNKCLKKYKLSIALTDKINRLNPEDERIVCISYESCKKNKRKYEKLLAKKILNTSARALIKTGEFLAAGARFACEKGLGIDADRMKKYVKRAIIGAAVVGGSYMVYQQPVFKEKAKELKEHFVAKDKKNTKFCFAEECGKKYDDKYGNLKILDNAYDDLCVVLAALEGFHDKAFDDRLGNMTIGYGSTFYIDENGKDIGKIKAGDVISKEDAFLQKQRYIAEYMVPCLMQVDRKLSEKEIVGFIATGFCIGQNELKSSKFLKLLSAGNDDAWQALSVYGKQAGVRKRTALTSAYVKGEVSTKELLDFGWKDGENIYGAKISDFYKCPKGSEVPCKDERRFCENIYYDKVGDYVRKVIASGVKNPVRDILPEDVVKNVEKEKDLNFMQFVKEKKEAHH